MWQRFTERARQAVFYAQEEAIQFGEEYVSTEHLLLGLLRETRGTAVRMLSLMDIYIPGLREAVVKQLPQGKAIPSQDMTLTPRAKRVIDLAFDESRELNHKHIGTEHLLLGLIREENGLAGRVLQESGVRLAVARDALLQLCQESYENPPPRETTRLKSPLPRIG